MYINESRRGASGIGFLALQDHGWQQEDITLDQRITIMGVRVKDRHREQMPVGYYKYEEGSVGDIIGSNLWQSNQGASSSQSDSGRELHGWRFTPWPVKTIKYQDPMKPITQAGLRGSTSSGCTHVSSSQIKLLPIKEIEDGWVIDERFKHKDANSPPEFPKTALGAYGIVVSADNEGRQDDLFFSLDPRLVAVNFAGDPTMGSLVSDLNAKGELDPTRTARLQSAFRVLKTKNAKGCVNFIDNTIALQIGTTGCADTTGGILWDTKVGGVLGQSLGSGPMTCGDPNNDKHQVAKDEDGHSINSAHISTGAYFYQDNQYDAPLKFDGVWEEAKLGPESFEVFLEYDDSVKHGHVCGEKEGIWRWRATSTVGSSTTTTGIPPTYTTGGRPPAGGQPPEKDKDWPTIGGPPPCGTGLLEMERKSEWGWAQTTLELGAPTLNFQPMFHQDGRCDTSTWLNCTPEEVSHQKAESPMVSRLESFGLQNEEDWTYFSQPGLCQEPRYSNRGSAHGGLVFLPPQLTIADYVADRQDDVTTSTATFIIADSTRLGIGTPSVTEEGGLSEGFYHKYDPSTQYLELRREDDTRYMYMERAGDNRVWIDQPLGVNKCFSLGQTEVTISGNEIAPTSSNMVVDEDGPYDYDYLYTIGTSGVAEGQIVILKPASGKTIYIREYGTGNINGEADLTEDDNVAGLIYTAGAWTIIFSKEG